MYKAEASYASSWTVEHFTEVFDDLTDYAQTQPGAAVAILLRKTLSRTCANLLRRLRMVGRGGLEPPTSRLSGVRSNHLSYRPNCALPVKEEGWWSLTGSNR